MNKNYAQDLYKHIKRSIFHIHKFYLFDTYYQSILHILDYLASSENQKIFDNLKFDIEIKSFNMLIAYLDAKFKLFPVFMNLLIKVIKLFKYFYLVSTTILQEIEKGNFDYGHLLDIDNLYSQFIVYDQKIMNFSYNLSDDNKNSEKNINNFDNIFINNKNEDDSKGSDFVYKFILDNANETEDNFQKKYEKIIKDAENKQKNKNLKNNIYQTTIVKNKRNSQKYKSVKSKRKRLSTFTFSEIAKNLMKNEGLKESSISITSGNNIKLVKRNSVVNSVKISGKNNDVFLEQKDIENSKNEESIISILGNLV
jgi:hypothetical protein